MEFVEKVVLITGASSGIGTAAALEFAKLGAKLALVGRNAERLKEVGSRCEVAAAANHVKTVVSPLLINVDITDEKAVPNIIYETMATYQRIDVLVNSAGIIENGSIETTSMPQYDRVMNINVRAVYQLTMLAVPELIKTKGNIINVSSVCGLRAFPNVLAYNLSKAAIDQFTRCVALELASKGVRCNSVNPGVIVTDLHKRGGMDEATYEKFLENCKATHALGRPGQVDEVASVICFLASDKASFITAANMPVDGGRHAMCPR